MLNKLSETSVKHLCVKPLYKPMVALVNYPVSFGVSWRNFDMSRSFSEMLRKCEANRCFGAASAVSLCYTRLFCWRESWAWGLSFWSAICNLIPLVWRSIVTKRRRLRIKRLEWVSDVWWGALTSRLGLEQLLLRIKSYESCGGLIWLGCLLGFGVSIIPSVQAGERHCWRNQRVCIYLCE